MDKLRKFFKSIKIKASVAAVALIIIGLLFIIFPGCSANVICYVAGAFLMVWGALCLFTFFAAGMRRAESADLALGLTFVLVALLLFIKPWVIAGVLTVIFGIALIVDGALKLQKFVAMNRLKMKSCWAVFVVAVISVVLGTLIVFDPFGDALMIFAGVSLIVIGVLDMVTIGFTDKVKKPDEDKVIDLNDDDIHVEEN